MAQMLIVIEVEQNLIASHPLEVDVIMYRRGLVRVLRPALLRFNLHAERS